MARCISFSAYLWGALIIRQRVGRKITPARWFVLFSLNILYLFIILRHRASQRCNVINVRLNLERIYLLVNKPEHVSTSQFFPILFYRIGLCWLNLQRLIFLWRQIKRIKFWWLSECEYCSLFTVTFRSLVYFKLTSNWQIIIYEIYYTLFNFGLSEGGWRGDSLSGNFLWWNVVGKLFHIVNNCCAFPASLAFL